MACEDIGGINGPCQICIWKIEAVQSSGNVHCLISDEVYVSNNTSKELETAFESPCLLSVSLSVLQMQQNICIVNLTEREYYSFQFILRLCLWLTGACLFSPKNKFQSIWSAQWKQNMWEFARYLHKNWMVEGNRNTFLIWAQWILFTEWYFHNRHSQNFISIFNGIGF